MYRDPDEIEAELVLPPGVVDTLQTAVQEQDAQRGPWPSPRQADQPFAPWPGRNNQILQYLLLKAEASLDAGMEPRTVLTQLAVHAWFEGGIENYDRGRRDEAQE